MGSLDGPRRRAVQIVARDVRHQFADHPQAFGVVVRQKMRHAADAVVRFGAAQLFLGHVLVRDGLDHLRPGDEHVAGALHHEDEVGERRRIDRAARARPHDGGDLRNHAARERIAQEDIGVTGQRRHAFLNARASGIVQPDHRRAGLQRQVHDLANFQRVGFRERSAQHGEILREDVNQPPVNVAVAGDEAVAVDDLLIHSEIGGAMPHQLVHLFECACVQQQIDALARRKLAFLVLPRHALFAAARLGIGVTASDLVQSVSGESVGGHTKLQ